MKQFVLNEDNLRKGWSGASEFWFSRQDMQVHSMAELADLDHPEDTAHRRICCLWAIFRTFM